MSAIERRTGSKLALKNQDPQPYAPRRGEEPREHVKFILWAFHDGEVDSELARRFDWSGRRSAIETLEGVGSMTHAEKATQAMRDNADAIFIEMNKRLARSASNPDAEMSNDDLQKGIKWLTDAVQGIEEQNAKMADYTQLSSKDQEIMLQAKAIQDRMMGVSVD